MMYAGPYGYFFVVKLKVARGGKPGQRAMRDAGFQLARASCASVLGQGIMIVDDSVFFFSPPNGIK